MQYVGSALFVVFRGFPSPVSLALGIATTPSLINLFILGLVAGSLSFGGAYTAISFIQVEAVLKGSWLPQSVFVDCIAIGNILSAPLVIFATFVAFQGGLREGLVNSFAGAVLITVGMFFPCFLFTIAGHGMLERLVRNKVCSSIVVELIFHAIFKPFLMQLYLLSTLFDGLCGAVIGVIAIIAVQILQSSVQGHPKTDLQATQAGPVTVLYMVALAVPYKFTNKWAPLVLLACGAIDGQSFCLCR